EEIQDPPDGLGGIGGVQGGKDEMTGVGGAHGGGKADGVAHFADHDDIGVLAQNVFEAVFERKRVKADFALLDDRLIVLEDILDRVLQSNDMLFETGVDVFDHGRQGGRFATTSGAGQQHDAAR